MSKIGFLKKGFPGSEEEKSKNLTDVNKESYKNKRESKTLKKSTKKEQKEFKKKEKKELHSKKKIKLNKSKKTLGGKKPCEWSEGTKDEFGENKETYIQLHVESDQSFKELLLDIYFDENAPNFFKNENEVRWRPTTDEMDSILEAFDILSQSSVSLEKKIDKLSEEFYFKPEKIEVEQSSSDIEQKEIDVSPMSGDVFNNKQVQSSEDLKKNTDGTLVNLEKKTDDLSESDKLSEVFTTPPKKSTESNDSSPNFNEIVKEDENKEGTTPTTLEKKTDDLSESDKLSEVFKTSSEKSPKIEAELPTSNSEQEEIDTTPTTLEKKTDDLSESDGLFEVFMVPPKDSTETEDAHPESREAKEDENKEGTTPTTLEKKTDDRPEESPKIEEVVFNPEKIEVEQSSSDIEQKEIDVGPMSGDVFNKEQVQSSEGLEKNTEGTTPTTLEKKTGSHSEESSKIEEIFTIPPKKATESNDISADVNKIGEDNENKEGTTPTTLEKKTDDRPEESPKIEEVVFNPEKIEDESPTSDSEQEEMHSRPRLDKVLFRRVEKT